MDISRLAGNRPGDRVEPIEKTVELQRDRSGQGDRQARQAGWEEVRRQMDVHIPAEAPEVTGLYQPPTTPRAAGVVDGDQTAANEEAGRIHALIVSAQLKNVR